MVDYNPQLVKKFPESDRRYLEADVFAHSEFTSGVSSVVSTECRELAIQPFELIDPKEQAAPAIRSYAGGRTLPLPRCTVSHASNARVSGAGLILSDDFRLLPESTIREHHAFRKQNDFVEIRETETIGEDKDIVEQPTIILTGVFPLHFSHWIFDNYAKLTFLKQTLGSLDGFKIAVGFGNRRGGWCKPGSIQYDCLKILGFGDDDIIMLHESKWTLFRSAFIASEVNNFKPPMHNIWSVPEIFDFFRDTFREAGLKRRAPSKRIHFSRTDDPNRKCINEPEVIDLASSHGFEEKIMRGVPIAEQMQFFSDVEIAIGPAGNNLLTMFAMQPGSKLITYFPKHGSHIISYYQTFCSAMGIELYAICGSEHWYEDGNNTLNDLRWNVDVDSIAKLLDRLC